MQLIEGSNHMYYLLVLLHFHDYFASQMIWAHNWQLITLCTRSMIAFACGCFVVTCSWFGFNAIIVLHTHLFEVTFEFAPTPIVKDNKLRLRVTCQPGVMEQILDGGGWLICGFDLILMDPPDPHRPWTRNSMSDSAIFGGSSPYFLHVIVRHNGMHKHSVLLYSVYIL
jgi:hypothetical protein